uniref:Uncharacterized protein n=1 Tax=Amphora coffeiformis TaxID=265554 RepID=A0A7S3KYZ6_9STRA
MTTPATALHIPTATATPVSLLDTTPSSTTTANGNAFHRVTWTADIQPHLQTAALITGSFVVAWAWDLLLYAVSHTAAKENPLRDQIGFAHARAPPYWPVLLVQYLVVCALAAVLSHAVVNGHGGGWDAGARSVAIRAIEFIPSPVFAGKLMAYLGNFDHLGMGTRAVVNLAVTAGAAILAHALPLELGNRFVPNGSLARFTPIVQETLGFGLGIAWNVWLGQVFGPHHSSTHKGDDHDFDIVHFIAMAGYLAVVLLLALRLSTLKQEYAMHHQQQQQHSTLSSNPNTTAATTPSFWERQYDLASFAMQVVCAFTIVAFLDDFLSHNAWYGTVEVMALLLVISAVLSALVSSVDLDVLRARQQEQLMDNDPSTPGVWSSGPATCLLFIPCLWCCCPWVPAFVLLSSINTTASTAHIKEDWYALIAMVMGLAASIEASNLVTAGVDTIAAATFSCTDKHCPSPWLFCALQGGVAIILTIVLIPALGALCQQEESETTSVTIRKQDEDGTVGEKQSLLAV